MLNWTETGTGGYEALSENGSRFRTVAHEVGTPEEYHSFVVTRKNRTRRCSGRDGVRFTSQDEAKAEAQRFVDVHGW